MDRAYIERKLPMNGKLRFGKFGVPLGIFTPEHWAISVETIQKPIHEDNLYVPNRAVGVMFQGQLFQESNNSGNLGYTLFLSNGSELFATNKPKDNSFGGGGDLKFNFGAQDRNKVGISYYRQNNPAQLGRRELNYMTYADYFPRPKLLFRFENFRQERDSRFSDIHVFYASVKYQLSRKTYLNYRWNKGDDEKNGNGADQTAHCLTLGWWLKPYIRTKWEFSTHRFQDPGIPDFNEWAASIGVIF